MKRLTAILLTLALLLCRWPAVSALEPFRHELREDGVWITGANVGGDLTVPAEIGGVPVVDLADDAFYENETITSVALPEGLRFIGAHVFTRCTGIREPLRIPDSVEFIEPGALWSLAYSGKEFSAADRYSLVSDGERFSRTGTIPGYSAVQADGCVYWMHAGEAELVAIRRVTASAITLPASVQGAALTAVGPWCCVRSDTTGQPYPHITVPGTVKRLRAHAFQNGRLASLFLAEGVQTLEPYSLAVNAGITITVPASAVDVTGPLFKRFLGALMPQVYACGGSEAARLAEEEGCALVQRDAADGRYYGVLEGMAYYIQDGAVTIYGGKAPAQNYQSELRELPAQIEGCPVTEVSLSVFAGLRQLLIPPTVTDISYRKGDLDGSELLLYYPGTYAERFCRRNGLIAQSVYAYWMPPFDDVPKDSWYYNAVCYVYGTGLMFGTSAFRFAPNTAASRAMLVTVLWRMAGAPEPENGCPFADVPPGSWCEPAVCWAYAEGISKGVSETAFSPDAPVTREQLAALLLRYAQVKGMAADERAEIVNYPDAGAVSDWAVEAVRWARAAGIIKGNLRSGDVYLDPQAKARRCEIAEMLMRFCTGVR